MNKPLEKMLAQALERDRVVRVVWNDGELMGALSLRDNDRLQIRNAYEAGEFDRDQIASIVVETHFKRGDIAIVKVRGDVAVEKA